MAKNAITMTGDIVRCWLFVYRVPATELEPLLPRPLKLFTKGEFGFLNVVVSELRHMRPKGLPSWLGMGYRHVAYRLHCRFEPANSEPIEGLYFLRSDADSRVMAAAGNLLTDFRFHVADIRISDNEIAVGADGGNASIIFDDGAEPAMAQGSPFATLEEAQRELKYKPAAFFVHPDCVDVLRITRDESAWRSKTVTARKAEIDFVRGFDATLEVSYQVEPIRYIWNRAERFPI